MPDLIDIFPRNQQLALARSDLQFNFETINQIWGVNHVNFDNGAQQGKHSEIDLLSQQEVPDGEAGFIKMANVPDQFGDLFLYFVKQATDLKMEFKQWNTPGLKTFCIRLPSGIILKMSLVAGTYGGGNTGRQVIRWRDLTNGGAHDIPFSTQLWANVWCGTAIIGGNPGDNRVWPYVENINVASEIAIRMWQRDGFDSRINTVQCISTIFAIGV